MNTPVRGAVESSMTNGRRRLELAWAMLFYLVLAVACTWPLAARLTTHVPAGDNDLWQTYWNFWWWSEALGEGRSPYATDRIYQPGEVSLAFHTHSEANVVPLLPVVRLLGPPAALNLATLLSFALCGLGAYCLCRELTGDRRAALIGGIVFALFPQRVEQSLEHLNLASAQAMPFFLLFLLRLTRTGGWKNVVLTAATFSWNALCSWHNGLLVLPAGILLFAVELWRTPGRRAGAFREATLAGLLAIACCAPFLWPMVREIAAGATYYIKPPVRKPIDPLFLLVPPEGHPLWGGLVTGVYERLRLYASAGFTCYAGLGVLALAASGFLRRRRETGAPRGAPSWPWAVLAIGSLVLACGDSLVIAGRETSWPLPFALLRDVPLVQTIRLPNRFVVPAMLALGVLAARGASRWLEGRGRTAAWACGALVVLDLLWVTYPTQPLARPAWIDAVAKAPPGILLDLPGGHRARGAEDMYLATLHGRSIAGGYASCIPPWMEERVASLPLLGRFFEGRPKVQVDIEAGLHQVLRELPVAVLVIHLDRERERLEALAAIDRGTGERRLHNPEKGSSKRDIEALRAAARSAWGEPVFADAEAEVFARPGG